MTARLAMGLVAGVFGVAPCQAQVTAEQLAAAEIRTEKVGEHLYVLFGLGGNIAVSVGTDGVLAVDTQFPDLVPRYLAAIREIGGQDIDFAINTTMPTATSCSARPGRGSSRRRTRARCC